eukprot:c26130_g1_i3 orf=338-1879(+)
MAEHGCLICAPLIAKTVCGMLDQMLLAEANGAHVIEFRLDHIVDFNPQIDLQTLLKARKLPAIVTYRPKWEGGEYEGDDKLRLDALQLAADLGAEFVDVELQVAADFVPALKGRKPSCCQIIVSNHNFQTTPSTEELGTLVATIQSTGADIVKFATTANNITDVANVFQILSRSQVSSDKVPMISLVMGERGLISRILCPKFGGYLTFGSVDAGQESAPGQPTLLELKNIYQIEHLRRDTKVFGIIGNPVGHSKSPILHNAAFRQTKIDAVYVPFLVDNLEDFLRVFCLSDFAGFSVTIPHKESALKCCDEVESTAQAIGAVNTIIRRKSDGKLIGYNTDSDGAISAIEDALSKCTTTPLAGRLFVVIGAGGAGKALAFGAKRRGSRIVIANRNYERAKALANLVGGEALPLEALNNYCPESGMILANTTSVGMQPNITETPIAKEALRSYSLVFDAVYTPSVTQLLKEAAAAGTAVVGGLEMLIRQAAAQFELFTGYPAPIQLMREVISQSL